MIIRDATENDYQSISNLFWESDNYHFKNQPNIYKETKESFRTKDYFIQLIEDPASIFLILEENRHVEGFIYGYEEEKGFLPFHKERKYFFIDNIVVNIKVQNLGYGAKLLDKIIEECRNKNYSDIVLNVYSFNQKAISLYEKKGFSELSKDYILALK